MTRTASSLALEIAGRWRQHLTLDESMSRALSTVNLPDGPLDVIAVGKAAYEMVTTCRSLGRTGRTLAICDHERALDGAEVLVGEHPLPGPGSLAAGVALERFVRSSESEGTLWLISGGASSLCASPRAPISLDDLDELWRAVMAAGADITTFNQLRAATSTISGGLILRSLSTQHSTALIMVDNVVSGAPWVASGLTYDHALDPAHIDSLATRLGLSDTLRDTLRSAVAARELDQRVPLTTNHTNVVVAEPIDLLRAAMLVAEELGLEVLSFGSEVTTPVEELAKQFASSLKQGQRRAVLAVGETSVAVRGGGQGGRCQEFVWRAALELEGVDECAVAAVASDGRDHVVGVGGAFSDGRTIEQARTAGIDVDRITDRHDTYGALRDLGQLLASASTGWNLCDLYIGVRT